MRARLPVVAMVAALLIFLAGTGVLFTTTSWNSPSPDEVDQVVGGESVGRVADPADDDSGGTSGSEATASTPLDAPDSDDSTDDERVEAADGAEPETPARPRFPYLSDYPQGKIYGVMTENGVDGELDQFAEAAGRRPNMVAVTAGWAQDEFSNWFTERIAARGAMPIIFWEPWNSSAESSVDQQRSEQPRFANQRILDGDFDDYIDRWAEGLAAFDHPVVLRFAHEMNGYWYPWADGRNGNADGSYVEMWRHVHDRFEAAGADNVIWVWSPNVAYQGSTPLAGLYPGDDYVDWVGLVGYFGHHPQQPTASPGFEGVFDASLDLLADISDRPVLITETGSAEYGELKVEWITDAVADFASDPRIMGFVWFNVDKEYDWRIDSSPESLDAFRAAIDNPRYADAGPEVTLPGEPTSRKPTGTEAGTD